MIQRAAGEAGKYIEAMRPRPALPAPDAPSRAWRGLASWPSQCALCLSWPSQPVCQACLSRFARQRPRCPGCALAWTAPPEAAALCPDCQRQPLPLRSCLAAFDYGYPWNTLLTQLKFHGHTGWAAFFAEQWLTHPEVAQLLDRLSSADWMLPMPLSHQRLAERGFNQAWELARTLHRLSGTAARLDARLLLRVRDAPPQTQLERTQRLSNLHGAFAVDPLRTAELASKNVLLIDDVMTTGASLSAAALALLRAGARSVSTLVVARTPA